MTAGAGVSCRLSGVTLERPNGFAVTVPDLRLSSRGAAAVTKVPLMGESGAGKSSLLNVLAAMEWPQQGQVQWCFPDGRAVRWSADGLPAGQARALRQRYFGYAFQDSTLVPHLTVRDNLSYPLMLNGCPARRAHELALQALERVLLSSEKDGAADLLARYPVTLSGGQRQRVALVQALIHQPCVLFADEPTGSLDTRTRQRVMETLYRWVDAPRQRGRRMLVWVTHHDDDPRRAGAARYLNMHAGRGSWEEAAARLADDPVAGGTPD